MYRSRSGIGALKGGSVAILRIEHAVPDFAGWKRAFASDPADRKGTGARRYQVLRSVDDPDYVMIDPELDSLEDAAGLLAKIRRVWSGDGQQGNRDPQGRLCRYARDNRA